MTHAAMAPRTASSTSETIVMTAEVPNAYQNWKFELLMTAFRFFISCPKDAPLNATGLSTMEACALKELSTTRKNGNRTYRAMMTPTPVRI